MEPRSPKKLRVACLQLNACDDWRKNLKTLHTGIQTAVQRKAQLVVSPENCLFRGEAKELCRIAADVMPSVLRDIRKYAQRNRLTILLGGVPEKSGIRGKVYNTAYLVTSEGRITAKYRKIHLFDVQLDKVKTYESRHIVSGKNVVVAKVLGIQTGIAICYDLRFPELFRSLARKEARIVFVPANFTYETGRAHWEVLLRARAIENQIYIVAAGQVGIHPASGIRSFGTSLIIDPWGNVCARASRTKTEIIVADLDFSAQDFLRRSFPVLSHCKLL